MIESKFDLTNQRFGKLTVIKRVDDIYDNGIPRVAYLCRCDCGKERVYRQARLDAEKKYKVYGIYEN